MLNIRRSTLNARSRAVGNLSTLFICLTFAFGGITKLVDTHNSSWWSISLGWFELALSLAQLHFGTTRFFWFVLMFFASGFGLVHVLQFFRVIESCNCFGSWSSNSGVAEIVVLIGLFVCLAFLRDIVWRSVFKLPENFTRVMTVVIAMLALTLLFLRSPMVDDKSLYSNVRVLNTVEGVLNAKRKDGISQNVQIQLLNDSKELRRIIGAKMDCSCSIVELPVSLQPGKIVDVALVTDVPRVFLRDNFERTVTLILDDKQGSTLRVLVRFSL